MSGFWKSLNVPDPTAMGFKVEKQNKKTLPYTFINENQKAVGSAKRKTRLPFLVCPEKYHRTVDWAEESQRIYRQKHQGKNYLKGLAGSKHS